MVGVWWGAFVAEEGGVLDTALQVRNACMTCKADHKDPAGGDCAKEAVFAVKSSIMNLVTLVVGTHNNVPSNGNTVYGQFHRRELKPYGASSYNSTTNQVTHYSTDSQLYNSVLAWSDVMAFENVHHIPNNKRDAIASEKVRYFDAGTGTWVTLINKSHNESCGTLVLSEFAHDNGNSTRLEKKNYSLYPMCSGYIGIDYCANKSQWGGIYASGELASQIDDMISNDIWGTWTSDYYKLYTVEQDGSTEDWQLSFKMYYSENSLDTFRWTHCDTGS